MITLEQLKQMAIDAGYTMTPGPYSYLDDPKLRAFIYFDKHIVCDWTTVKCNIAQNSQSCLDPNLIFEYDTPQAGGYFNVRIKVHPGVMYGQEETATISSSIPFYQNIGGKEVQVTELNISYLANQQYNVYCYPEANKSIEVSFTTPTMTQSCVVNWNYDNGNNPQPPFPEIPRVGSAKADENVLVN